MLVPVNFAELVAAITLAAPAMIATDVTRDYVERKRGRQGYSLAHPMLAPILEPTLGLILYQEQITQIVAEMAGLSLLDADDLRRAVGRPDEGCLYKEGR